MAGALKYMSDHENRLQRFKSNLFYIFDKYENCEDDDTEIDLHDLSLHRGRKQFIRSKTKGFGHSKLRSTPREGNLNLEDHGQNNIPVIDYRQQTGDRQKDDLQATYVVSRSDDLWNSHRNQPVPLIYDEPDCLDPRQRIDVDPSDVDPREVDHFSDDSSRIQCLNETYKDVLSLFGPDEEEEISDAETLTTSSDSEESLDEDFEDLAYNLSSSEESDKDQTCRPREMRRGYHGDLQSSPRMESYFASSEDSSGYHSSEIQSSLIKRSQIHKQYRHPETNISYRQIQNHFLSGDAGLVSMKRPNYRQQIQNLYKSSSRKNSGKSDRDLEKKQRGRNSLCLDEFEASFNLSQSMMTNGASEYCSQPELKVGTPGLSNQPMSSIEKVTKWILPPQEGGGIDRYTVKAKRKLSIQKVPESSAESYSRGSELSSIMSSSCGNSTITTENLLHQNQMRNTEFDGESMSGGCNSVNCFWQNRDVCNCTDCVNKCDSRQPQQFGDDDCDSEESISRYNEFGSRRRTSMTFACPSGGNNSAFSLPPQAIPLSPRTSTEISTYRPQPRTFTEISTYQPQPRTPTEISTYLPQPRTFTEISTYQPQPRTSTKISASQPQPKTSFFSPQRAHSCPSSPQSVGLFPDPSSSPSSSLARLRLSSPRSSPRASQNYYRRQALEEHSPRMQATCNVQPVFKVPNAFPYERSPSTKRGSQRTLIDEGEGGQQQVERARDKHVRSNSCDNRSNRRFRSQFNEEPDWMNFNGQCQVFHSKNLDSSLSKRVCGEYQQEEMESGQQLKTGYPLQSLSRELVSVRKSKPKCIGSLFSPQRPSFTLKNRVTCNEMISDRGDHWNQTRQEHSKISSEIPCCKNLQSTPKKRNCELVLDTSLSTINPNVDSSSDEDEVILI